MNAAARAHRLLRTVPHRRSEPWGANFVTAQLLAYALGVREEPVSDAMYHTVARRARYDRSDYPTEAKQVPLALARVLALAREGRDEEAAQLLGAAFPGLKAFDLPPEPVEPVEQSEPIPEPAPAEVQDAGPAGSTEVVPEPEADEVPGSETPLPATFPERDLLDRHGYSTLEAIARATDMELRAINGLGPAKVSLIRAALTLETG